MITIASPVLEQVATYLSDSHYTNCLLLSDSHVFSLYEKKIVNCLASSRIPYQIHLVDQGESTKTIAHAEICWQKMHQSEMERSSLVISFGGGAICDLAGFVSSCYMRGIDLIHIPTTLLAMVDACIGGKTGVNLSSGKNLVGTFYHPKKVFIDPTFLHSLSKKEFCSGIAEIIKYGVIRDPDLFQLLEQKMNQILQKDSSLIATLISKSLDIKIDLVNQDPLEKGVRAILNYGHTFAHAIETATQYRTYTHGEAVAIGICCAAETSRLLGFVDQKFTLRQKHLCHHAGLPTALPKYLDNETLIRHMRGDKKTVSGKIRLILPHALGNVSIENDLPYEIINEALTLQKKDA